MASSKSKSIDLQKLKKDVWASMPKPEKELTREQKTEIDELITKCHQKVTSISESFSRANVGENTSHTDVEALLLPLIGKERIQAIKGAFERETFTINIEKEGSSHVARILRENKPFKPEIRLLTMANLEEVTAHQIASLVVEVILLLLGLAGIALPLSATQIERITGEVIEIVNTKAAREIINELVRRLGNTSAWQRARAIWDFIVGLYDLDLLNRILSLFFEEMSWWEKTLAIAQIIALVLAGIASGGLAIIGKIVLETINMGRMVEKIANMTRLQSPGEFKIQ